MKKIIMVMCILGFVCFSTTLAYSKIISINARFFVDSTNYFGYLDDYNGNVRFVSRLNLGAVETYSYNYVCDDKWSFVKIRTATEKIQKYLNNSDNIDFETMLSEVGFSGCKEK